MSIPIALSVGSKYIIRIDVYATVGDTTPVASVERELTILEKVDRSAPVLALPATNPSSGEKITLSWTKSESDSTPSAEAKSYTLFFGESEATLSAVDARELTPSTTCKFTPETLIEQTSYLVRVDAFEDAGGATLVASSEPKSLAIKPVTWPDTVTIQAPSEALAGEPIQVSWAKVTSNAEVGAAAYTVKAGSNTGTLTDVTDCVNISGQSCSVAIPGDLAADSSYYIQVEAFADANGSNLVASGEKTITIKEIVWSAPVITAPAEVFSTRQIDLSWTKSTSTDGVDASAYRVTMGPENGTLEEVTTGRGSLTNDDPPRCSASFTAPDVNADTPYTIRVEAFEDEAATILAKSAEKGLTVKFFEWSAPEIAPSVGFSGRKISLSWTKSASTDGSTRRPIRPAWAERDRVVGSPWRR